MLEHIFLCQKQLFQATTSEKSLFDKIIHIYGAFRANPKKKVCFSFVRS